MTEQHWNEFLEKLDFAQLTSRWSLLPLHWLDDDMPVSLEGAQEALYRGLQALPKELDQAARDEQIQGLVRLYREARAAATLTMDASLTPPASRVTLRYLNPDDLGQGDCLITVGSWDRLGHFIAEQAGVADEPSEPSENPIRRDPGELAYRHLLIFPDKATPTPRAFRALCEKTLRQARGLGARRLAITHLHLPQPGLPDRFAAAELVSAVRQTLRDGSGITVEILPLTEATYNDYRHWFLSLADLARGEQDAPDRQEPGPPRGHEEHSEPVLTHALRDLAQKTSSLAQEAGRGVSTWFRNATAAASNPAPSAAVPPRRPPAVALESTFADQQALNLLYLGRWKEAEAYRHRWEEDTLLGLYLAALYKVVSYLDQHPLEAPAVSSPPEPAPEAVVENPASKGAKKKAKAKKKGKGAASSAPEEEAPAGAEEPSLTPDSGGGSESADGTGNGLDGSADQPAQTEAEAEYLSLREQLLSTAQELGADNPLARYFQLLAWRLDQRRPDADPDQLEEDHARLLRAAWAWEDTSLLTFLRQVRQDQESEQPTASGPGSPRTPYVPVFPSGSRPAPRLD